MQTSNASQNYGQTQPLQIDDNVWDESYQEDPMLMNMSNPTQPPTPQPPLLTCITWQIIFEQERLKMKEILDAPAEEGKDAVE